MERCEGYAVRHVHPRTHGYVLYITNAYTHIEKDKPQYT